MENVFDTLYEYGIIPVVTLESADSAVPVARALADAGLPVAEITFRSQSAAPAIRAIAEELPDFLVGAGTVLTPEQAHTAITAGAKFIVSPGTGPAVVEYCLGRDVPVIPGVATPTEIETALHYKLDAVKFFPAEQLGGLEMLRALAAPYRNLKFVPTGGINLSNLADYTAYERVLAVGGSFMTPAELVRAGKFDEITRIARDALFAMYGFSLGHVGINCDSAPEAHSLAATLAGIFGQATRPGSGSVFVGSLFELMEHKYYGERGHIGIATNTVERAMKYFERLGFEFEPDGLLRGPDGKINAAYIKGEIAGFALHLMRKSAAK
ncbi:MAG: bifunctional 4-hydroxy-2-oxoglutarate aldolase/2-dehydro-3-deoxy-phosphogluconate aldolase [Eubacteriales bacterium]|jgi:2-dehydro-3-deoxyphosphogluconate aldolase/(4S)-4-hydroxy-2-oxoglutarate aldolase|nr:bifunctional 4-hydroxy-2-oxoglutarate aldolase/2-dehydro-3-deoxy-phosphogluconate aldolase [Clostridiales bacterium]